MKNGISVNHHSTSYTTIAKENRMWLNILMIGVVGAWFAAAVVGRLTGVFSEPDAPPLRVGLFVLVPILGFSSAYFLSSRFRRFAKSLNLELMTMSHLWRFVGLSFIYGYLIGFLPAGFALPAGIGDILVAATALPRARHPTEIAPGARDFRGLEYLWPG